MVLLSLVVPVYNVQDYIEECLISISDQLVEGVEVIIVNDGTKDKSINIVESHITQRNLENVYTVINQENQGLSAARNTGILNANGQYIAFLDSDDKLSSSYFDEILKNIKEYKPDIIQMSAIKFDRTKEFGLITMNYPDGVYNLDFDFKEGIFEQANWFAWLRVYKAELFDKVKFPVGQNYEDACTIPLVILESDSICTLSKILVKYRINNQGISASRSKKNIDDVQSAAIFLINLSLNSNALLLSGLKMMHYCLLISMSSEEKKTTYKRWVSIKSNFIGREITLKSRSDYCIYYLGFYYVFFVYLLKKIKFLNKG